MKRRQLASCSPERWEALRKAHEEFEQSELKRRLDEGWKIRSARVKRPRIKPQPRMVITLMMGKEIQVDIKVFREKYEPYGFRIIQEIY